ncbi:ABC transporter ATP-binding protein [Hydrogenispora ethanolica]|nr:ABC transporter ATP-binding protein [Hydrogenispora ethanolica]
MADNMVQLVNVVKDFGSFKAVKNISLDIKQGEFLTLLGPSGCGKTTTLRMIAGFEEPTSGRILLEGRPVEDKQPHERNVNTVFQNYALFPHMNVYHNIAFGLVMKNVPKAEVSRKVGEAIALVQLTGFEKRMPDQLSGGQCQRVAIARAIVNSPKVLLLDEPLGALDLKLRKQMQVELKHLQKRLGITFVYVTHDQEEALTMSDRIAVMNRGVIEQIGTPDQIYERPETRFVAGFIGETNLFEGVVGAIDGRYVLVDFENGRVPVVDRDLRVGDAVYLAVRPERIRCGFDREEHGPVLRGWFKERIYAGSVLKTIVSLPNSQEVVVNEMAGQTPSELLEEGKEIYLSWDPEHAVVMKARQEGPEAALAPLRLRV